jgi:anaerobic ribonucleoside-triphosphate reductase activating protein
VDRIFYPVLTLGYGRRIGIWTIGCPHACPGCSNLELWARDPARNIPVPEIMRMIATVKGPVDGVTITGGEPFLQIQELHDLVMTIKASVGDDIMVYTGYTIAQLQILEDCFVNNILGNIAVLIDGIYRNELNDGIGLRGSANQQVHIMDPRYEHLRTALECGQRQVQNVHFGNTLFSVGIPMKSFRESLVNNLSSYGITSVNKSQPR